MVKPKNAMEVFSLLNKSNCRLCGEKTCLAFAGAVYTGMKSITECPCLPDSLKQNNNNNVTELSEMSAEENDLIVSFRRKIVQLDYEKTALRIGGESRGGQICINVLGKPFGVDAQGQFKTDLHLLPWLVTPVLEYICNCEGNSPQENWISFREIPDGREQYGLFQKRGETVFKSLADKYPDFFQDIIHMFDGKKVSRKFESDISVVLHPLPLVPMMLCYWKAEDGMDSSFNLFFDSTIHENLGVQSAFFLGTGIAQMVEKIAVHHGF